MRVKPMRGTLATFGGSVRSAAVEPLRVRSEELVARLRVEVGGDFVESPVELVEGAVHGVDRKVAREHAPIDAERREALLEPGPERVAIHRVQGHGEAGEL